MAELTQQEIDERVAILKRFKLLLEEQKKKFQQYLNVLELQEGKIQTQDDNALLAHSELEAQIVEGIGSLQKVIVPMQKLYNNSRAYYSKEAVIPVEAIQNDLSKLQKQVLAQNEKNRSLLKSHMNTLRKQILEFKNPYRNANTVYAAKAYAGTRIAIEV